MYTILRNRITDGSYQLTDMQRRIKKLYALGDLTQEQLEELLALSQENATADAERPEMLSLLRELAARVEALEKKENTDTQPYETWTAWDGISDNYPYGAIVSHNGQLWQSVFAGQNVWEPGVAGTESLWTAYAEGEGE